MNEKKHLYNRDDHRLYIHKQYCLVIEFCIFRSLYFYFLRIYVLYRC